MSAVIRQRVETKQPCPKCGCPDDLDLDSSSIANASWIECGNCEFRFQKACDEETLEERWNKLSRKRMPAYAGDEWMLSLAKRIKANAEDHPDDYISKFALQWSDELAAHAIVDPTPAAAASDAERVEIFVCYTNTDLTEGRGYQVPYAWAESRSSALRLASKKGVQGCDAEVRSVQAFKVGGTIFGPVRFERATDEDKAKDLKLEARLAAIAKARAAGLSDDEIASLTGAKP